MSNLPFLGDTKAPAKPAAAAVTFIMPEISSLELTSLQERNAASGEKVDIYLGTTLRQTSQADVVGRTIASVYQEAHATTSLPPAFLIFDGGTNTSKVVNSEYVIQDSDNVVQIKSTSDAALLA